MKSSKTKHKLYVFSLSGRKVDIENYTKYRNKFTHLKEQSKRNYYKNIISITAQYEAVVENYK